MNLAELEYYMDVAEILKDDEELSNRDILLSILHYHRKPIEERTNDDGITFLIVNAIRKHRGIPYPTF